MRFLVPWRPDGGQRDRLWGFTQRWWARECPEIGINLSCSPDGPFNRSAAINAAAIGDWDVAVVLDADVIAAGEQVREAVARAIRTQRVTLAFDAFVGLDRRMTERVLAGYVGRWEHGVRFRSGVHASSIVAVPRRLWDQLGGFDERFVGWGGEDAAFAAAARIIGGDLERIPGPVWHLFHTRSPEHDKRTNAYRANRALLESYLEAVDEASMLAVLREREMACAR